jgi:hypothetical protein
LKTGRGRVLSPEGAAVNSQGREPLALARGGACVPTNYYLPAGSPA